MRTLVVIASFLLVMGAASTAVGQTRKTPLKALVTSQERVEGFYLEMPTTYLLPKEIQGLLKATVQGKAELEDRYSKLYTDKIRLGNFILIQVEAIRNARAAKLDKDTWALEMEMGKLKKDNGVNNIKEVGEKLAEDRKATDTRTYPPGYTAQQVSNLYLEEANLQLVLTYDKVRNDTQKDLDSVEGVLAFIRNWMN